jgi:chromate transporter
MKIGSVLFGSGYVLVAFLSADLVHRLHWSPKAQLIDAVAAGQITPGPVFFDGDVRRLCPGRIVRRSRRDVRDLSPRVRFRGGQRSLVPRLRASRLAAAFLDGVNVASLALMAVVTAEFGRAAIVDLPTTVLAVRSALLLLRFTLNSTWLVLGGAAVGIALHRARTRTLTSGGTPSQSVVKGDIEDEIAPQREFRVLECRRS